MGRQVCNPAEPKQRKHRTPPLHSLAGAHPGQLGVSLGFRLLLGSIVVIMRGCAHFPPTVRPCRVSPGSLCTGQPSRLILVSIQRGNKMPMEKIVQILLHLCPLNP